MTPAKVRARRGSENRPSDGVASIRASSENIHPQLQQSKHTSGAKLSQSLSSIELSDLSSVHVHQLKESTPPQVLSCFLTSTVATYCRD